MINPGSSQLQKYSHNLDLILLHPALSLDETVEGCHIACNHHLPTIFVKPCFVSQAVETLRNEEPHVGTIIDYPHGAHSTQIKINATKRALSQGVSDLEMVANTGYARSGFEELLCKEIQSVSGLVHMNGGELRVILETGYLTPDQIINTTKIAVNGKADGMVISTGYGPAINYLEVITMLSKFIDEGFHLKLMDSTARMNEIAALIEAGYARVGINDLSQITN